jgi:anaerobic magnesium-protoporphyrin IX monomethyl ester cyclase
MRYCLINLPSPFLINEKVFPNLGILYLSSYLKKEGHEVVVIDNADGCVPEADLYGISAVTPQYHLAIAWKEKIRSMYGYEVPVIIGGPHASVSPKECIRDFDRVTVGDGELSVVPPLKLGIIDYQPLRFTLDMLPFPDRDAIDIHSYKYHIDGKQCTTMITSRGCPYDCAFCTKINKKVKFRSANNVLEEVAMLRKKYGFEAIMFFDDIFILNRKRLRKIAKGMKNYNMLWRCFVRADLLDEEVCELLSKNGCVEVGMGVESGSQKLLDLINKRENIEQIELGISLLYQFGIRVKVFLIIGLPGESEDTINETYEFLKRNRKKVYDYDFTVFTPYPGSRITNNVENYDIFIESTDPKKLYFKGRPGGYNTVVRTSELAPQEIVRTRDEFEKEFKIWR